MSAWTEEDDPLIGKLLPGGIEVRERVGVGGMGVVYRAEQKILGRTVAVKTLHPYFFGKSDAEERFIIEARAASALNHPNSVSVIDFGKYNGSLYLVMEYLRGRDLERVSEEDGPLDTKRAVAIVSQILAAVWEAHGIGIVHRDLKPANIVLSKLHSGADQVKVLDFGLAEFYGKNAEPPDQEGQVPICGTRATWRRSWCSESEPIIAWTSTLAARSSMSC